MSSNVANTTVGNSFNMGTSPIGALDSSLFSQIPLSGGNQGLYTSNQLQS